MSNLEPEGGLRDRLIIDSMRRYVHDALETIGWFGPIGPTDARLDPIQWLTKRVPDEETIPPNAMLLSREDHDIEDLELGSNASTDTFEVWIDFWATEADLGEHVQGDIAAILRGQRPAAGCEDASFPVLDTDGLTELFLVEISDVHTHHGRDPRTAADVLWYAVVCRVTDERP